PMPGADRWPVVALTPTAHPLDELLERTAKVLGSDLDLTARELAERPEALLEAVRARSDDTPPGPDGRRPPPVRPVLPVHKCEDLSPRRPEDPARRPFVRFLRPLSTAPAPAAVVLGARADFPGRCLDPPELARVSTDGLFVLPPMPGAELRASIPRPAELA